jgi:hypothetical protein
LDIIDGSAPSKKKAEMAHRVGAIDVGALTTLRTFGCTNQTKMVVKNLDQLAAYQGAAQDDRL